MGLLTLLFGWLVVASSSNRGSDKAVTPAAEESPPQISPARQLPNGAFLHTIRSAYQKNETQVRVLVPSGVNAQERANVLYVLPVEPNAEAQYGDPLEEILKAKLHEKQRLICVFPTFDRMPWYADHSTDPQLRQESYFLKVVVPFVEQKYPVLPGAKSRWLLGFSKGGWGAFSLLLRHPDQFDRAAAWDVPYLMPRPDRYGMLAIFGTQENFDRYRIPQLLTKPEESLKQRSRLVLLGYNLFREHQVGLHELLLRMKIPHDYEDGPKRAHRWDSGWLPDAISRLKALPAKNR